MQEQGDTGFAIAANACVMPLISMDFPAPVESHMSGFVGTPRSLTIIINKFFNHLKVPLVAGREYVKYVWGKYEGWVMTEKRSHVCGGTRSGWGIDFGV
jgi:hypothetical protein